MIAVTAIDVLLLCMLRPQLSHDGDASSTESDKYTEKAVTICRAGSQM